MKKKIKNIPKIGIIMIISITAFLLILVTASIFKEVYCLQPHNQVFKTVPVVEADIKQVPSLNLQIGQQIGQEFSKELKCERGLKNFILF